MAAATRLRLLMREMTPADIPGVRRIEVAAYEDAWPQTTFEEELRNAYATYLVAVDLERASITPGERAERWWDRLRSRSASEVESPVAGYCGAWFHVDQLHVVTVAVEPALQGHGIAQRLLLECFDRAVEADLHTVTLEVRPSNVRAQEIYRRFGFQQVGVHRRYYANNGEDAIVMLTPELTEPEQRARLEAVRAEVLARFPEVDWLKSLPEARGGEVGA